MVDSPGDNILAEFNSVVDAVDCAVKIQEEIKAKNSEQPENRRMEFRIGVNLGDVIEERERIYGNGVIIAARLERLADVGGICISGTTYDHVADKLGLEYKYLGEKIVKNIKRPVRVYRIGNEVQSPSFNISGIPEQEYLSKSLYPQKILLIEDDQGWINETKKWFKLSKCLIDGDGGSFQRLLQDNCDIDLVLIDYDLGDNQDTGDVILEEIRDLYPNICIGLISGIPRGGFSAGDTQLSNFGYIRVSQLLNDL